MERRYELRTDEGKTVTWTGETPEDAAQRAADCLRVTIVATRPADRHGLFSANPKHVQIIEPGDE